MRIQHNIMAMNAYRNFSSNTSALSKNLEKLSSGYKINRAGDDAAGLAISEKMRAQISGLAQAQKNAKSGINLVQTAEGALTEVHDMLNRMFTLAEQSANGTYDDGVDRNNLQKEFEQLRTEIDRIADSSNFNGIELLNGKLGGAASVSVTEAKSGTPGTFAADLPAASKGVGAVTVNGLTVDGDVKVKVTTDASAGANNALDDVGSLTGATLTTGSFDENLAKLGVTSIVLKRSGAAAAAFNATTGVLTLTLDNATITGAAIANAAVNSSIASVLATLTSSAITGTPKNNVATSDAVTALKTLTLAFAGGTIGTAAFAAMATTGVTINLGTDADWGKAATTTVALTDNGGTTVAAKTYTNTAFAALASGATINLEAVSGSGVTGTITLNANEASFGTAGWGTGVKVGAVAGSVPGTGPITNLDFTGKTGKEVIGGIVTLGTKAFEFVTAASKATNTSAVAVVVSAAAADTAIAAALKGAMTGATGFNGTTATVDGETYAIAADGSKVTLSNQSATGDAASVTQSGKGLTLQIGDTADSFNQMTVSVGDMHAKALGIGKDVVNIGSQAGAQAALEKIKAAINQVSSTRGDLGAMQNRLDHTINNLSVMQENIQDAEATIRDTDVAEEMMAYTKNNILVQSAQAMLAQANQVPQGVLQLLQ